MVFRRRTDERSIVDELDTARLTWWKSSYCADNTCIEVAWIENHVLIRNSKDQRGPVLEFSRSEWAAFANGVRDGEFQAP